MDSVDDSIIATPADTSNLPTPESSSSEVSQPTVKLRVNGKNDPNKHRMAHQDIGNDLSFSVDGHQPFLQTLDQDGRRLVETTGRTAQRARSLNRLGSRFDEKLRQTDHQTKTDENSWPEFHHQPRKSQSTTSVISQDRNANKRNKRRHHSYGVEYSRRSWKDKAETPQITKRYSAGDYLRQQILEDLSSNELIGKTEEQIAEDRCNRVKAYLRRKNVDSSSVAPNVRLRELRDCWKSEGIEDTNDSIAVSYNATRRNDLDRIRSYLQDKIRARMNEEEWRSWEIKRLSAEYPNELSMQDIRQRYSDYRRMKQRDDHTTRRVRSDVNVRREMALNSESGQDEENPSGRNNFQRRASKGNVCRRTRSDVIPETVIDPEDGEVRKRFYSYSGGHRNSWKTKSCLTFESKLSLPNESFMNLDHDSEPSPTAPLKNNWEYDENFNRPNHQTVYPKNRKKYCRRSRSDTLSVKLLETTASGRRAKRRSVSWSDKRKLHRRTSERRAALANEVILDSEGDSTSNSLRGGNQQGNLCSWREYKEKRRQERLVKEKTGPDDDTRKLCMTQSMWNNFSKYPTKLDLDKVCPNERMLEYRQDGSMGRDESFGNACKYDESKTMMRGKVTSTNENSNDNTRNVKDTTEDTETETIIQENYLLLESNDLDSSANVGHWSPIISKLQVNEYRDPEISLPYELNMMDVGYDTIPKRRGNNDTRAGLIGFNANSNVKKSDTFKIVDGSENSLDDQCQRPVMCNFDVTSWSSNEMKSSLDGRAFVIDNDPGSFLSTGQVTDDDRTINIGQYSNLTDNVSDISVCTSMADDDPIARSNKDIARDYFKRVYELLKQRQNDGRRENNMGIVAPLRHNEDTSSSNCVEYQDEVRKRRRRRKKDKTYQGEELVAVSAGVGEDDHWTVQKLLVNDDPGGNLIFRRPQLQNVTGNKRPRNPAPPIPVNCKINAKDISKYFDYPNKENSSPRNGVNENKRVIERNEPKERQQVETNENEMGSNLSRHNGKGLTGRRTQSSGNLCDPKGKLNNVGKILVPCSSAQRERYKICGSLPNHLDDKEILDDEDPRENNNVISDTMVGNLGGTLPHKKRSLGVHFSDTGPTGTLDLVKHRSQDSLEGDPWRYQDGADLDLVRCKHGNFDLVRKNQNTDVVDGDSSSRRYGTIGRGSDSKCHRGADLDLVGTLPKKRPIESKGAVLRQSFEARQNRTAIDRIDGDLVIKVMHKPDCELMKHRQFDRVVDLKLSRLIGGEPQDQGYASERSPEDEHPPSLPGQPFPNVTSENTFRVILQKSSRGLGLSVSGGGPAGPVRVKRLFPQQPAALSNKLQSGDILLAANGVPLTGLTNYEALEVLRTTPSTVELVVCRLPGDAGITPPGAPPPPPARREPPPPLRILNPLPPLKIEPCGEFDIEMTKVAGSLGFTLRKVDSSALGHYVRALVREPALSDGRIQPGDKIVAVDGATLSPMSHEEAVALLRQCGPRVKLRLYRDLAQTPVSALSPTEPDHPLRPPRTSLRQEAVDMLCDLAVRKLSPGTSNGSTSRQTSGASCNSPRRLRRPPSRTPTAENEKENHLTFHPVYSTNTNHPEASDNDQCSINTQPTNSQSETPVDDIIDPPPLYDVCDSSDSSKLAPRPSFLNLGAPPEKPHFQFSLESGDSDCTGPIIVTESDSNLTIEGDYDQDDLAKNTKILSSDEQDNNLPSEPASMPPLLSTTRTTSGVFSYKNPAYQSANPTCGGVDNSAKNKAVHSSDHDIPGKVLGAEDPAGSKGLLKWKGVMFAPNDDVDETTRGNSDAENNGTDCTTENATRQSISEDGNEMFMVELTRGWNSRLGFSLQPEGNSTVISVVHPDSVAAKDGRLKQGDVLIMVNDESVKNMPTAEIIDLLRKIRGSIGITVMRRNKMQNVS